MKRFFVLLLIVCLISSLVSVSLSADMYMRFSTYGTTHGVESVFDGDTFALDLYMTNDLTAYIQTTVWKGSDATSSIKMARIRSKVGDNKTLYFVFADDSYYTGHYDETYDYMFWLDLPGGSVRLKMADEFILSFDFAGD